MIIVTWNGFDSQGWEEKQFTEVNSVDAVVNLLHLEPTGVFKCQLIPDWKVRFAQLAAEIEAKKQENLEFKERTELKRLQRKYPDNDRVLPEMQKSNSLR